MAKKRSSKKKTSSVIITIIVLAILAIAKGKLNLNSSQSILEQLTSMVGKSNSKTSNNATASNTADLLNLTWDGKETGITTTITTAPFTSSELSLSNGSWTKFSELDSLNRAGQANAMLGPDLLPTKERDSSITWDPTGFKNKKVTVTTSSDGTTKKVTEWLYNRCHLIGFQLTGENTNPKNLVTGTRILNMPEMTNIENKVAEYIKTTKHHVRYQVTPVYKDNELVCRGIQMKAQSVEDDTIKDNIYIFNVEPGVTINYTDGTSKMTN